ncbi:MAG: DUF456 domain-containing protein [Chloroflexi bacterium]|nr:DUF456 domain-containing protein [Chloroflexota bacterium]
MSESVMIVVALVLMGVSVLVSVIPFVPGPLLVWAVGLVFAILNDFERVTYLAFGVMTVIMIAGSTSDYWMQALGFKMKGGSCLTTLGSIGGGIVGTFAIPVPLFGTVIGMVLGALAVELMRVGDWRSAVAAGRTSFELYLIGVAFEITASLLIGAVFALSIWLTG